ncbi:MAG: aspartate carbamoyltransferase, partial [Desulfovibrionaceae bacterium]
RTLLILGDIAHSRVARSNAHLLSMLGVKVRMCAPRTLLPAGRKTWPVEFVGDVREAVEGVDAVMCLRLQLERQEAGLLPSLSEYSRRFCLTPELLGLAKSGAPVLHPGPMNRGLEISAQVADCPQSRVLDQVSAGVATRMAVLYLLATRKDGGNQQ